jgi:hypothetical protein
MYFTAHVTVRKFTKTTTIWVWFIHKFTYFISSDKYFCEVHKILVGVPYCLWHQIISWLVKPHWNFNLNAVWERQSDLLHKKVGVSCNKTEACIESNIKTACCTIILSWQSSIPTSLDGTWTESLKLQAWGNLTAQTWNQYLQYFF